jgi:predicted nucleotidyltransferase
MKLVDKLTNTDRQIAQEFQQRLRSFVPILDFCIFGSRVRGHASEDSDLDVFIEVERLTPELRRQIFEVAWEVGFERDRVISTIVATREDLQHGAFGANPLMRQIEEEGVHL